MTSPLHDLVALGQSPWLDSITREWLDTGELGRMREELAITGVTSNPTIFAAALRSSAYDAEIQSLAGEGLDDRAIFEKLAVADIQRACDAMRDVYDATAGADGMVSIEVEPDLAEDTDATLVRGRELWDAVDRPNLMIKVPATGAGLPAIEELLFDGINVNVTLLFSVGVYRDVMERYLRALERRADAGRSLEVASVASFFVSRVDTAVDSKLAGLAERGHHLLGKVAVANAHAAWAAYREIFEGPRFAGLVERGARPQRPLWASTGTKNPDYSDILYVQELIAPGTVNTMPLSTLRAFADHGEARVTIEDTAPALALLDELAELGIDLEGVTAQLRDEGVAAFQASFDELLAGIATKRGELSRA